MNNPTMKTPDQLLTIYFDGEPTAEECEQLAAWLKSNPVNVERFVYASFIHRSMYDVLCGQDAQKLMSNDSGSEGICAEDFWTALLEEEKSAPSVELEPHKSELQRIVPDRSHIQASRGRVNRLAWVTAFASLAAFVFLLVYVHFSQRFMSEPVAVVTDVITAGRQELDSSLKPGGRLFTRRGTIRLDEGVVKITFDNGADVVIEGPSEFEVITYDEISLTSGRLYANVPHRTVGFIVSTLNAKVIDLGTGFGVYADATGSTDVHVLDGKVSLVSGTRSDVRQSQVVSVNEARRVERGSEAIRPITFKADAFVQDINSKTNFVWRGQPLDAADLAGGGNGLGTGRRDVCIEMSTGTLTGNVPRERIQRKAAYVLVPELEAVDGVFIPEGSKGPIPVTSAGHLFACPATLGESYYGVFNGSVLPLRTSVKGYIDHPVKHRGTLYGIVERPVLFLHSNLGITFDLDKIRKTLPRGSRITGFSAGCGVAEGPEGSKQEKDYSDFYVLVDGTERFAAADMNYLSELKVAEVELADRDRFLTLMTTEGKDGGLHLGWSFFAEPRLYFEVSDK